MVMDKGFTSVFTRYAGESPEVLVSAGIVHLVSLVLPPHAGLFFLMAL